MGFLSTYLNIHWVRTFFFTSIAFTMFKSAGQGSVAVKQNVSSLLKYRRYGIKVRKSGGKIYHRYIDMASMQKN